MGAVVGAIVLVDDEGQTLHTIVVLAGIPSVLPLLRVGQHVPLGAVAFRLPSASAKANSGELMQPVEQFGDPVHKNGMRLLPSAVHSYRTAKLFAPGSKMKHDPSGVLMPGEICAVAGSHGLRSARQ